MNSDHNVMKTRYFGKLINYIRYIYISSCKDSQQQN